LTIINEVTMSTTIHELRNGLVGAEVDDNGGSSDFDHEYEASKRLAVACVGTGYLTRAGKQNGDLHFDERFIYTRNCIK
jgi:hypothetical protein